MANFSSIVFRFVLLMRTRGVACIVRTCARVMRVLTCKDRNIIGITAVFSAFSWFLVQMWGILAERDRELKERVL